MSNYRDNRGVIEHISNYRPTEIDSVDRYTGKLFTFGKKIPDEQQIAKIERKSQEWSDIVKRKDEDKDHKDFKEHYEEMRFVDRVKDTVKYMSENLKKSADALSNVTQRGAQNWDIAKERIYAHSWETKLPVEKKEVSDTTKDISHIFENFGVSA